MDQHRKIALADLAQHLLESAERLRVDLALRRDPFRTIRLAAFLGDADNINPHRRLDRLSRLLGLALGQGVRGSGADDG
jgi:hypothetical protein